MKIFITGANGFVGKSLFLECQKKRFKTIGVDVKPDKKRGIQKADICSQSISKLIPLNTDVVIHLAGLSRQPDCQKRVFKCFDINVMGTLNLIEAAKKKKVKQFIFASSEWVYGDYSDKKELKEDQRLDALSLKSEYALSKLVSESNLKQRYDQGFCPVTIFRFGIIYGPRKSNWSAVESLYYSVKTKDKITVRSLKSGRCFIHIDDIVTGIIKSIGLKSFNIINLGGSKLICLKDIIKTSKMILGKEPLIIESEPENISIRNMSNKKASKLLNWQPKISLDTGLKSLI